MCDNCKKAADNNNMKLHKKCTGKGKCPCQHASTDKYPTLKLCGRFMGGLCSAGDFCCVKTGVASADISDTPVPVIKEVQHF